MQNFEEHLVLQNIPGGCFWGNPILVLFRGKTNEIARKLFFFFVECPTKLLTLQPQSYRVSLFEILQNQILLMFYLR